jgi:hypothetical protein
MQKSQWYMTQKRNSLPLALPAYFFFFAKTVHSPVLCTCRLSRKSKVKRGDKKEKEKKKSFARVSLRCRENEEEKRRKEIMLLQAASAFLHKAMSLTGRKKG